MPGGCVELAANLTAHYLSPALYDDGSSLADFLAVTGVLLSMCLGGNCTTDVIARRKDNVHLSGSWIQQNTNGPRVFGLDVFGMATGIGMVLDPHKVDITCIYPLDGVSDQRDDMGCGPLNFFMELSWWQKQESKLGLYWKKYTQFPRTKWEDIPCSELFDFGPHFQVLNEPRPGWTDLMALADRHDSQSWKTLLYVFQKVGEKLLGHTICHDDLQSYFQDHNQVLAYVGDEVWQPSEWNDNSAVIQDVIRQHPTSHGIWNEIVIKKPEGNNNSWFTDIIQAIFYVRIPNNGTGTARFRDLAYSEAKRLGIKHVLEFEPLDATKNIFECPAPPAPLGDIVAE